MINYNCDISQKKIKNRLDYCPETGVFKWIIDIGGMKAGDVAGNRHLTRRGKMYRTIMIDGVNYRAHRLAWLYMFGCLPSDEIDHIDGDGLNNKIENLRIVDRLGNCRNKRISKSNRSGATGVKASGKKWIAQIKINRKSVYLGTYTDWFDAVCARKSANNRYGFHQNHGN
jgi:hypothetical protein